MAASSYYDSGQFFKNLLYTVNPGFEGWVKSQIVWCGSSSTTSSCVGGSQYDAVPANFWRGATFQFVVGAPGITNCSGTLSGNGTAGPAGVVYTFASECSRAPAAGDWMIIRKAGTEIQGWSASLTHGALYSPESLDLPAGTHGSQAAKLDLSSPGAFATLTTYLDSTNTHNYVLFNGKYELTFKAKLVSGSVDITASVKREGGINGEQSFTPTHSWSSYTLTLGGSETSSTPAGTVTVQFSASGTGVVELDDVSLQKISPTEPGNATVYRDEVVSTLKRINPGTLRLWDGQAGESLDDWISPVLGRKSSSYGISRYVVDLSRNANTAVAQGLFEFLQLCEAIGASPWIVVPTSFSTVEGQDLIDFLNGPISTAYGAKRAALNHPAAFSSTLPHIYLSLGNEAWNSTFAGESMDWHKDGYGYKRYGDWAARFFGAIKQQPSYSASSSWFTLVIGCQPVANTASCADAHNADPYHDAIEVASYLGATLTAADTLEDEWQPEAANAWADTHDVSNGVNAGYHAWIAATARPVPIMTYEFNQNTLRYSPPATPVKLQVHDAATMNAAVEISAAMERLKKYNAPQNFWNLAQSNFNSNGVLLPIYGTTLDMGGTFSDELQAPYAARPQLLGQILANEAILGREYSATVSNIHTYSVSALNGLPPETDVPTLFAYAFRKGTTRTILLINTDPFHRAEFTWSGDIPVGTLNEQVLTNVAGADDTNETTPSHISIKSSTQTAGSTYSVPAASIVQLRWSSHKTR